MVYFSAVPFKIIIWHKLLKNKIFPKSTKYWYTKTCPKFHKDRCTSVFSKILIIKMDKNSLFSKFYSRNQIIAKVVILNFSWEEKKNQGLHPHLPFQQGLKK